MSESVTDHSKALEKTPIDLRVGWQTTRVLIGVRNADGAEYVIPMTAEDAREIARELLQRASQVDEYLAAQPT